MSDSQIFYPFANQPPTSNQNVFPYDIIINEAYPGIIFDPTEPGGVYSVIREVDGCLWFVNNADFDMTLLEWTQEDPTNPALPAYALELCADGTFNRYFGAATTVPGTPVSWQLVFEIDANGSVISTPPVVTASGDPMQQINVTWNAGSLTQLIAREVDITLTSADSDSIFDELVVNGTQKWVVDINGILQVGEIPFARISGFSPVFNGATFTGTTTFNGPITANDGEELTGGLTVDTVDATGTITASAFEIAGGGFLSDAPTTTSAGLTMPAVAASVTVAIYSSHGYPIGTTVVISGPGTNSSEIFTGIVTANNGQPATSLTVLCAAILAGTAGDVVSSGAVVSFATVYPTFTGTGGQIVATNTGTALEPVFDLELYSQMPAVILSAYNIPAVGASTSGLQINRNSAFYPGTTLLIANGNNTSGATWLALVTNSVLNLQPSEITLTCLYIFSGTAGDAISADQTIATFGGYFPAPTVGASKFLTEIVAIPAGGSISIPIPGTSANTFSLFVQWVISGAPGQFWSATITLSSGTVTSPVSNTSANANNDVSGGMLAFYAATVTGGQTIVLDFTGSTSGSGGTIDAPVIVQVLGLT